MQYPRRRLPQLIATGIGFSLTSVIVTLLVYNYVPEYSELMEGVFYPVLLVSDIPHLVIIVVPFWLLISTMVSYYTKEYLLGVAAVFGALFGGLVNIYLTQNICCGAVGSPQPSVFSYTIQTIIANVALAGFTAIVLTLLLGIPGALFGSGSNRVGE